MAQTEVQQSKPIDEQAGMLATWPKDQNLVDDIVIFKGTHPRNVCINPNIPDMQRDGKPWTLDDFYIKRQVYRGKASIVYKAEYKITGRPVTLKLYRKSKLSELNKYQVLREVKLHINLYHENIIAMHGAFEDEKYVYLALEQAEGGDLYEYFKHNGSQLPERFIVSKVMQPFLLAIQYLHSHKIIHRDIKPENILLTDDLVLKLADFGLSIKWEEERPVTRAGTLDYMAPEVVRCPDKRLPSDNKENNSLWYDNKVDSWAAGVLAYELLVGRTPFERSCRASTVDAIKVAELNMPQWFSEDMKKFLACTLVKDSQKRYSAGDLLKHPWIQMYSMRMGAAGQKSQLANFAQTAPLQKYRSEFVSLNSNKGNQYYKSEQQQQNKDIMDNKLQQIQYPSQFATQSPHPSSTQQDSNLLKPQVPQTTQLSQEKSVTPYSPDSAGLNDAFNNSVRIQSPHTSYYKINSISQANMHPQHRIKMTKSMGVDSISLEQSSYQNTSQPSDTQPKSARSYQPGVCSQSIQQKINREGNQANSSSLPPVSFGYNGYSSNQNIKLNRNMRPCSSAHTEAPQQSPRQQVPISTLPLAGLQSRQNDEKNQVQNAVPGHTIAQFVDTGESFKGSELLDDGGSTPRPVPNHPSLLQGTMGQNKTNCIARASSFKQVHSQRRWGSWQTKQTEEVQQESTEVADCQDGADKTRHPKQRKGGPLQLSRMPRAEASGGSETVAIKSSGAESPQGSERSPKGFASSKSKSVLSEGARMNVPELNISQVDRQNNVKASRKDPIYNTMADKV